MPRYLGSVCLTPDGLWHVSFADLAVEAEAATFTELAKAARVAVQSALASLEALGESPPSATTLEEFCARRECPTGMVLGVFARAPAPRHADGPEGSRARELPCSRRRRSPAPPMTAGPRGRARSRPA